MTTTTTKANLAYSSIKDKSESKMVLDSGATEYFTPNKDQLTDYKPLYNQYIAVANGDKMPILGIGNIPIILYNRQILITKVKLVPNLKLTLISSKELANKGQTITFKNEKTILIHDLLPIQMNSNWE